MRLFKILFVKITLLFPCIVASAQQTLFHEDISNSTLIIFENSARFPDVEETEKFVDAIHNWLFK